GKAFTKARVGDQYAHRFKIHFPGEERDAGRPVRTRPVHDMQRDMGARMGLNYGWEHPLYFGDAPDTAGFTRQPWWNVVGDECRMLRDRGGIIDISNFAKYRVAGPEAEEWLNALFANRMPRAVGRSCLTPLIGKRGGIAGDFTVTRLAEDEFWVIGSGMAERYHQRFFRAVPLPGGTTFESLTDTVCGFNVAGPDSRALLQRMTNASLSNDDFPFMRSQRIDIAGVSVMALRVSFTGDLGWELHCRTEDQARLYAALIQAGRDLGIGPVGSRALMSLRVEKGYGSWSREYSPEYWPQEVGLDRLVKLDKDFLNKAAVEQVMAQPARETLVVLALDADGTDASRADATGGEPIFRNGQGIGRVTSGAYGYWVGQSLALGFVRDAGPGDRVEVMVLGQPHGATILDAPPFDADGQRLRS
ncbi:MAG: glycine cleavage T C-terminal barrel domain-containing protein, partial [Pseudomonadota bacterium]